MQIKTYLIAFVKFSKFHNAVYQQMQIKGRLFYKNFVLYKIAKRYQEINPTIKSISKQRAELYKWFMNHTNILHIFNFPCPGERNRKYLTYKWRRK